MIFPPAVSGAVAAYEIEKSLRFRASGSAYLSRTPSVTGNRRTWTWSGWVKRGLLGSGAYGLFGCGPGATDWMNLYFQGDVLKLLQNSGATFSIQIETSALFRDPSAHYHVQVALDTTQATASNRVKVFINGVQLTSFTTATYPSLNFDARINTTVEHTIGAGRASAVQWSSDTYLSEINFIDGQALDPTSFGEFDANGVWVPKEYTGTYGTNGYYLPFSNGTSLSTLTADASGNGNNWTANNISLTAGVNYDWMDDTPTNNFSVLNPLIVGASNITKGNLASGTVGVRSTFDVLAINSYWEVTAGASDVSAGVVNEAGIFTTTTVTANKTYGFRCSTAGVLDRINITDGGSWTNVTTGLTGNQFALGTVASADWNFGQRPFTGSVPNGYAKLCAASLSNTAIITTGTFNGNANVGGPFVWLNGVPTAMTINGNAVTFGTHADKLANGFKVRSNSASYNVSGSNTYSITSTGAAFKNARAQVNP